MRAKMITMSSLQQFNTEDQFSKCVSDFLASCRKNPEEKHLLFIQSEVSTQGDTARLLECARFNVQRLVSEGVCGVFKIIFLLRIPRVAGGCFNGLSVDPWYSCHIDDLRGTSGIGNIKNETITSIFGKGLVSLDGILREDLPKAVSQGGHFTDRIQEKMDIIVEILKENDSFSASFVEILKEKIVQGLEEKLENTPNQKHWLAQLVTNSTYLKEGYSFQRVITLFFSTEVTQILSKLLAVADTDNALKLVAVKESRDMWQDAFLGFFRAFSRKDSFNEKQIEATFPFSRYIINWVDHDLQTSDRGDEIRAGQLLGAMQTRQDLWAVIEMCFEAGDHFLKNYVLDFVNIKFSQENLNEAKIKNIMCKELFKQANRVVQSRLKEMDGVNDILDGKRIECLTPTDIHIAYCNLAPRLHFLAQLFVWDKRLASEDLENDAEDIFSLDLSALSKAAEMFQPNAELIDKEKQKNFIAAVEYVASCYQQLLGMSLPLHVPALEQKINEIKSHIQRLKIVVMYLVYVCNPQEEEFQERLFDLVDILDFKMEMASLRTKEHFDELIGFLLQLNRESAKHHLKTGIDNCIICEEDIQDPVQLPCKHAACQECLNNHFKPSEHKQICPLEECRQEIPLDFAFVALETDKVQAEKHSNFKHQVNKFFLDVLQRFVFEEDQHTDEAIVDRLMSFVITDKLPKDENAPRTKQMSPFTGHGIDRSPVIRSSILQLLLTMPNPLDTARYLKKYLNQERQNLMGSMDLLELCLLVLYCLEDSLFRKQEMTKVGNVEVPSIGDAFRLLDNCKIDSKFEDLDIILTNVSRIRIGMTTVAACLNAALQEDNPQIDDFLNRISEIIQQNEKSASMKKLLVRTLVQTVRRDVIAEWRAKQKFLQLLPEELMKEQIGEKQDLFMIRGLHYKTMRAKLTEALTTDTYDNLIDLLNSLGNGHTLNFSLCLFFLQHLSGLGINVKDTFLVSLESKASAYHKVARNSIRTGNSLIEMFPTENGQQKSILALLHHFKNALQLTEGGLIQVLRTIAADPTTVQLYPTMPQDDKFESIQAVLDANIDPTWGKMKFYPCAKGHHYAIGDCTKPSEMGKCNECDLPIGSNGEYGKFAGTGKTPAETEEAKFSDETKPFHILGQVVQYTPSRTVRLLSGLQVAITQFFLHAGLAVNCCHEKSNVSQVLFPVIPKKDIPGFLMRHLILNVQQAVQHLGRNEDDVLVFLHYIIERMTNNIVETEAKLDLSEKKDRQQWEYDFAKNFIDPELDSLANNISNLASTLEEDKKEQQEDALADILNEKLDKREAEKAAIQDRPQFWWPRQRVTIYNLSIKEGENNLKEKCPNFSHLLKEEKVLGELHSLVDIVKLQNILVSKFSRKIDSYEMEDMSINDLIYKKLNDNQDIRDLADVFIKTFNKLKHEIFTVGEAGRTAQKFLGDTELSRESKAIVLFPTKHAGGQCGVALVSVLVQAHNNAVRRYAESMAERRDLAKLPETKVRNVSSTGQLVVFNEKQLSNILLANCEYTLDVQKTGAQTQW